MQTFVSFDASKELKAVAIAGGDKFFISGSGLKLEKKGGAFAERTESGSWRVRNCSSVPNKITLTLKEGSETFALGAGESTEIAIKSRRRE